MIFPKKKRKAQFGLDLSQLKLKDELLESDGIISGSTDFTSDLIKKAGTSNLGYGVSHTSAAANITGSTMSGVGKGVEMGKNFGPLGALIGGGLGGAAGLGKGVVDSIKNTREDAHMKSDGLQIKDIVNTNNQGVSAYNELEQKQVMEGGGEIPDGEDGSVSDEAVILGGKRHSKGGNDIIDENGEKVAETEREEIIFTKDQTDMIDRSIEKIDNGNEEEYFNLGSYIKEIIQTRTKDNSGKFKEIENANLS